MRYLIVEDDSVDADLLCRCLKKFDKKSICQFATTGQQALEYLQYENFDCIILDHFLPDYRSEDFIEQMNHFDKHTPIIVITAYGDESLAVRLMKKGVVDYIPKSTIQKCNIYDTLKITLDKLQQQNNELKAKQEINRQIRIKLEEYN